MGAAAILTIYPAVLVAAVLTVGSFSSSGADTAALLFVGLLAAAGLCGLLVTSRQPRSADDP